MLFFQDEGKTSSLLFTLSSPFQKKVSSMPSLKKKKKNLKCCLSEDTCFLLGWESHIGALCLFSLTSDKHSRAEYSAALEKSKVLRMGKTEGRDRVWWCGMLCYGPASPSPACVPPKALSMKYWAYKLISASFKAHTYSMMSFTYIPHSL